MIPFIRGDEVHNGRDSVAHVGLEAFRTSIEPIEDNHAVGPGHERVLPWSLRSPRRSECRCQCQ